MLNAAARAADFGWDAGGGLDNSWGNMANWLPDGLPGSNDNIVLTGTSANGPLTVDLNGTRRINRIESNGASGDYTFGNSAAGALEMFLAGGNVLMNQTAGSNLIVDADILFESSNATFRFNGFSAGDNSGQILINGDVRPSNFAAGAQTLVLTSTNKTLADRVMVNGVISDGPSATLSLVAGLDSGTLAGTIDHAAEVSLTGLNTYTGPTVVTGAKLKFNSIGNVGGGPSSLGAPTSVANGTISVGASDIGAAGTLRYVGTDPAGHSSDRVIHLPSFNSGGTIEASGVGPLILSGGTTTVGSTTTRTLTLAGDNLSDNVFSGVIAAAAGSGVQQLVKNGQGTWVLTAANTYEGDTTVNAGQLVLRGPSATIGPSVAGALNINASGLFILDGGTVRANDFNQTGLFSFKSGELELISGNTTTGAQAFAIGTDGVGRLVLSGGSNNFAAVTLHGSDDDLIISGGGTFGFNTLDNSAGGDFSAINANVQINGGQITTTHGEIRSRIQGTGGLTKIGPGVLDLTNSTIGSIYTGPTNIEGGTLRLISLSTVNSLPDTSPVTIATGAVLDITQMSGGETIGRLIGAGTILTADNRNLTVNTTAAASFAGTISGAGDLTKLGTAAQTFSGVSTYTGSTTVAAGTLLLAAGGSLDGTENVFVSGSGTVMTIGGGSVVTPGVFRAENSGTTLNLSSGSLAAQQLDTASGTSYLSTFNWTGGTIHLGSLTRISGSVARDDQPFRNALTLTAAKTLIVDGLLAVDSGGTLNIDGGSVIADDITTSSGLFGAVHGTINFNSGTMRFGNNQTFDAAFADRMDVQTPLQSGRTLEVLATATFDTPITLAGGTLTVNDVGNPHNLVLDSGTFNVAVGALAVPASETVDASTGMTINASGGLAVPAAAEFNAIGTTLNADAASTNDGQINAINSTLNFTGGLSGGGVMNLIGTTVSGTVNLAGDGLVTTSGNTTFNADILGEGELAVTSGVTTLGAGAGRVIVVDDVSVGSARLDLTDNKLIVTGGDAGTWIGSNYTGIAGLVDAGRGSAGNALWDGSGIITSDTRAINGDLVSIGVAKVSEVRSINDIETTTFAGQTVLGADVLAMVTWGGDATMDGKINIDDYGIIDGNINRQGTPLSTAGGVGVAAVPEPGAVGLLVGLILARGRRCRG